MPHESCEIISSLKSGRCKNARNKHVPVGNVYLKEEHRQITNSFKLRGASNTILTNEKIETFVTASTGNHALAVCHILSQVGKKGIIFVTSTIPESKLQKLKKFPFIELKVIEGDPQESFHRLKYHFGLLGNCFCSISRYGNSDSWENWLQENMPKIMDLSLCPHTMIMKSSLDR